MYGEERRVCECGSELSPRYTCYSFRAHCVSFFLPLLVLHQTILHPPIYDPPSGERDVVRSGTLRCRARETLDCEIWLGLSCFFSFSFASNLHWSLTPHSFAPRKRVFWHFSPTHRPWLAAHFYIGPTSLATVDFTRWEWALTGLRQYSRVGSACPLETGGKSVIKKRNSSYWCCLILLNGSCEYYYCCCCCYFGFYRSLFICWTVMNHSPFFRS